ncbi:hypothetical protein K1719_039020 [Acacia pycnantha]|nr:hypothetical protein K1719_039020 [Acacia pycnantha]
MANRLKEDEKNEQTIWGLLKLQENRRSISKLTNLVAKWDIKGIQKTLLQPFSPIIIATDENERFRVWNYEEATLLNSFDNHDFLELYDSLLLAASSDGNIRICILALRWRKYGYYWLTLLERHCLPIFERKECLIPPQMGISLQLGGQRAGMNVGTGTNMLSSALEFQG